MTPAMEIEVAEMDLGLAGGALADAEAAFASEYLRAVAQGSNTFVAQKQAELEFGRAVHIARAKYEIALERLRRCRK